MSGWLGAPVSQQKGWLEAFVSQEKMIVWMAGGRLLLLKKFGLDGWGRLFLSKKAGLDGWRLRPRFLV